MGGGYNYSFSRAGILLLIAVSAVLLFFHISCFLYASKAGRYVDERLVFVENALSELDSMVDDDVKEVVEEYIPLVSAFLPEYVTSVNPVDFINELCSRIDRFRNRHLIISIVAAFIYVVVLVMDYSKQKRVFMARRRAILDL